MVEDFSSQFDPIYYYFSFGHLGIGHPVLMWYVLLIIVFNICKKEKEFICQLSEKENFFLLFIIIIILVSRCVNIRKRLHAH